MDLNYNDCELKEYSKTELSSEYVSYGGTEECHTYEIAALENGEKYLSFRCAKNESVSGGVGGNVSITMPETLKKGSIMLDVCVNGGTGTMARNLFLLRSSSGQKVYTMSIGNQNTLSGATQGNYIANKGFTGEKYKTDVNGFYNLRAILSRNSENLAWQFKVYDKLSSYEKPIYQIEIPADQLKDLDTISIIDLWNTTFTDAYIYIKEVSLFTPTHEDLIVSADIVDEDSNVINEFAGKDKIFADLKIENLTSADTSVTAYMAVYYNNVLTKAVSYFIPINADEKIESEKLEFDLSEVTAYNSVEIMVWKPLSFTPLIEKKEILYSDKPITDYTFNETKSNVIKIRPCEAFAAKDAVKSNFTLLHKGKEVSVSEVRFEPLKNEIGFYLEKDISLDEEIKVESVELNSLEGKKFTLNEMAYPYYENENGLYGFGLQSISVCDSQGRPVFKTEKNGEYTVNVEFINNQGTEQRHRVVLCAKSDTTVKKLDDIDINIKNYSKYVYNKKFNLNKNNFICLIIEN